MFPLLTLHSDWGILVLRVFFGIVFVVHGWPKIRNWGETARNFEAMGFRPGKVLGPLVAIVEFFGGLLLLGGLYTQFIAAIFVVQFAVILIWKMKEGKNFVGGWEFDFILLGIAILLLVLGGGEFSLEHLFSLGGSF